MRYVLKIVLMVVTLVLARPPYAALRASPLANIDGPCSLLTQADILKETGLSVAGGVVGAPVPGTLGRCTWTAEKNRVIVTLGDAAHMQLTATAQEHTGGTSVPGLGSKAVAIKGASFAGGGFIVTVLDATGGFGVSILGPAGTLDRVVALAKIVEGRR